MIGDIPPVKEPISDKVLSADEVFKDADKYKLSYYEWLSLNGQRVVRGLIGQSSDSDIYEVPENHTLYLTGSNLSVRHNVNGSIVQAYIKIKNGLSWDNLIAIETNSAGRWNETTSQSYPLPIKFESGEILQLKVVITAGAGSVACCIQGFLTKKDIF